MLGFRVAMLNPKALFFLFRPAYFFIALHRIKLLAVAVSVIAIFVACRFSSAQEAGFRV